ncbi:hypothetical protein [Tepidibacter hydrothermalis]|uniref:DUF11 domain-containing protein n=1 Tax=Tepidibacter hydrothermalis TaxID=3036126 RepID=A0ABY8EBW4_9FIRM|nr:hypothetical protein [Tepidibacter hydrothermalis]WFD09064.1 hypothetical protein P4S50_11770 [Tepidibacter hydrothermalis]
MADNPKLCQGASYKNLNCCDKNIGISVVQPECHCLPDGRVVTNPSYVSSLNKSFWTYKLITDCNDTTLPATSFVIPICEIVHLETLTVSEKIDGCGEWTSIPYTLTKTDPIFGNAPEGFQFVKIEINDRYTKGVSVAYRLELKGNYPIATQPISVNTNSTATVFDCNGGFLVPECNPQGKLSINKNVTTIIKDNQAKLEYRLEIDNIGNAALESVELLDILFLPTQLTPGTITTVPDTLKVVINPNGEIRTGGNLGKLDPGGEVIVTYSIPIAGISSPGQYVINNLASVTSEGTEASDTATATIDVVELESNKCCNVLDNGLAEFKISITNVGDSPHTKVSILDDMVIPTGVTVRFSDFDGCTAVFARTGEPVPVNTDVKGNADIKITCDNIEIPKGASAQKIMKFKLVTSSVSGSTVIKNELEQVNPTDPNTQIFLGTGVLPIEAGIRVLLSLECQKPC